MHVFRSSLVLGVTVGSFGCTDEVGTDNPFDPSTSGSTSGSPTSTSSVDTGSDTTTSTTSTTTTASSTTTDDSDSAGAICGDGYITGNEECDCGGIQCTADGLDNKDCTDVSDPNVPGVITGGVLDCNPASCRFDTSACTYCGDGAINGIEECESGSPIDTTCIELGRGTAGELSCGADCTIDTSACTDCGYQFDFAGCGGGWTTGRTTPSAALPSWECGDPVDEPPYGPPGTPTGVWATRIDGYYSANESSHLRSPPLDLSACAGETLTMTLSHWHNFESLATNADGGIVQASTDGSIWTTLSPTGGSQYGANPLVATYPPVDGSLGFDGQVDDDSAAMLQSQFDLTPYAGMTDVHIRFVFGSDASSVTAGWYIDGFELLGGG